MEKGESHANGIALFDAAHAGNIILALHADYIQLRDTFGHRYLEWKQPN